MSKTIVDGINREKKVKKPKIEVAKINKTYYDLMVNKEDIMFTTRALVPYYNKLLQIEPERVEKLFTNPTDFQIHILKQLGLNEIYNIGEQDEIYTQIVRFTRPNAFNIQSSKKVLTSISEDLTYDILVVRVLHVKLNTETQIKTVEEHNILIDALNRYRSVIGMGTYSFSFEKILSATEDEYYFENTLTSAKEDELGELRWNRASTTTLRVDYLEMIQDLALVQQELLPEFPLGTDNNIISLFPRLIDRTSKRVRNEFLQPISTKEVPGTENLSDYEKSLNRLVYELVLKAKMASVSKKDSDLYGVKFANKYVTKKNRPKYVDELMANSTFTQPNGFDFIEYDEDVNLENITKAEKEFDIMLKLGIIRPITTVNGDQSTLRIRKLGREKVYGVFVPALSMIILDKLSSFLHEYAHFVDYNSSEVHLGYGSHGLSDLENFNQAVDIYKRELSIVRDKEIEQSKALSFDNKTLEKRINMTMQAYRYYTERHEIFARGYEFYLRDKGMISSLLGSTEDSSLSQWLDSNISESALSVFFTNKELGDIIREYFDNQPMLSVSYETVQHFNELSQTEIEQVHDLNRLTKANESEAVFLLAQLTETEMEDYLIFLDEQYDELGSEIFHNEMAIIGENGSITTARGQNTQGRLLKLKEVFEIEGVQNQIDFSDLLQACMKVFRPYSVDKDAEMLRALRKDTDLLTTTTLALNIDHFLTEEYNDDTTPIDKLGFISVGKGVSFGINRNVNQKLIDLREPVLGYYNDTVMTMLTSSERAEQLVDIIQSNLG